MTFSNVRRYCTVYFKSMKFIVLMLLATEHHFITSGKCLFQNSFSGSYVHSVISRLLFWHQLAAMISEHISKGAFSCAVSARAYLVADIQILMFLKSRWSYIFSFQYINLVISNEACFSFFSSLFPFQLLQCFVSHMICKNFIYIYIFKNMPFYYC